MLIERTLRTRCIGWLAGVAATVVAGGAAEAAVIELQFRIDELYRLTLSGGTPSAPGTPIHTPLSGEFPITVTFEDGAPTHGSGIGSTGNPFANSLFGPSAISASPYTSEVTAASSFPSGAVPALSTQASIYRDWQVGSANTFEAIYFGGVGTEIGANETFQYQRDIQRQASTGVGPDQAVTFSAADFLLYLNDLIGDTSFRFVDSYLHTRFDPVANTGWTVDQYLIAGRATLLAVHLVSDPSHSVPEPSSLVLAIMGIVFIVVLTSRTSGRARMLGRLA